MSGIRFSTVGLCLTACLSIKSALAAAPADEFDKLKIRRGIVAVLGLPEQGPSYVTALAQRTEVTIYFQGVDRRQATAVRKTAESAGLLGTRVVVHSGPLTAVSLADNVADGILVAPPVRAAVSESELLRVLRPLARAIVGERTIIKPVPDGIDEWTHPYHGPDNNPQSTDEYVRGRFRTQFIGAPKFSTMPEQTVIGGGRIYKAMGHIAHRANQNEMLNTLLCINAYNGTILWKRPLSDGFMIHRNTMVATDDALYMGDHESCKVIDAQTGKIRREIRVSEDISDGPVWKWMAIQGETLFALVGNREVKVETLRSVKRGMGHWPWGMWKGHDYKDPRTAFGFGRTIVAIDRNTGEIRWHHRDDEFLDARAVCLKGDRIFYFSADRFLACVDAHNGRLLWKNTDGDLLEAIGPNEKAQYYITGYATTCYMKCSDEFVFFAGPQRKQMVAARVQDGSLAWTYPTGNLQLVLRDKGIYAAGPQRTQGVCLDYADGSVLASFPARRACTRATGCVDSIFFRASGGTVRVLTEHNTAQHIAPMRPPCQDGVLISNGHLYWGPWMCGCQLSLYGNIGLCPAGDADTLMDDADQLYQDALVLHDTDEPVESLNAGENDWTEYRGNNSRTDVTSVEIPEEVELRWTVEVSTGDLPTAPVAAGELVFVADRNGVIRALDTRGAPVWKAYVSGPVYYAPAISNDRLFVGSADGHVHAFAARTGRRLWTFRVAPLDRRIPVFGKLVSRWPVAGGVAVENGTLYAAAGITHYDGTCVVALDAKTGRLKASNITSGTLAPEVDGGISLQGNLQIVDDELRFLGGGVYETARYDLQTLKCLNEPRVQVTSQFRTAFYPYYPGYGKYVSLEHTCADGNILCHDASYTGSMFGNLALQQPPEPDAKKIVKDAARRQYLLRRGRDAPEPTNVWSDGLDRRFTSFVVSGEKLIAAGHPDDTPDESALVAIHLGDGSDVWSHKLPAGAVKGGIAIDARGRIYVSLENGQVRCYGPKGS